jgi:hypothetical protein
MHAQQATVQQCDSAHRSTSSARLLNLKTVADQAAHTHRSVRDVESVVIDRVTHLFTEVTLAHKQVAQPGQRRKFLYPGIC